MGATRRFLNDHFYALLAVAMIGMAYSLYTSSVPLPRIVLPEHEAYIVEFSPDSGVMVTDGNSGGCIRDAVTGRVLVRLTRAGGKPATQITWPRFTADGRRVIVQLGGPRFGNDRTVTLAVFDVATGHEAVSFEHVGSNIWFGSLLPPPEYALSADGSILAFSRKVDHQRSTVTTWDIEAGWVIQEFPGMPPLALAPDGRTIAHGEIRPDAAFPAIRRLKTGRPVGPPTPNHGALKDLNAGPVSFSHNGRLIAAILQGKPEIREVSSLSDRHELNDGQALEGAPIRPLKRSAWFSPKATWFSRDMRLLFVENLGGFTDTRSIEVWDSSAPTPVSVIRAPSQGVASDAGRVATAHYDHISRWNPDARDNSDVKVFDLPSSQARLQFVETGVHTATISPGGRMLALPSNRRESTGSNRIGNFLGPVFRIVGYSPRWLLGTGSTAAIRDIRFHDTVTGRLVGTIDCAKKPPTFSLGFSPDSKTVIVSYHPANFSYDSRNPMIDWSVEMWDVPTGRDRGWMAICPAISLIFAGAVLDRRRSRRGNRSISGESAVGRNNPGQVAGGEV